MVITKDKIKSCAKNIVKCVKVQEGQCVFIRGGTYCQDLLEEVALNVLRNGAHPHISSTSDNYAVTINSDEKIKVETLERTPKHYFKMIENIDTYIVIEPYENPSIQTKFPREKLNASSKSSAPIRDILYGTKKEYEPGKFWVYAGWPSEKAAKYYGIDYNMYERFIVDGMSVPAENLIEFTHNLGNLFENAKNVYIKDELGTDCWLSIENRQINYDVGMITDEMIAAGDIGGNLPAGEIFYAPKEKVGEGKIFCPLTIDRFSNKIIKNVELHYKEGKLQIDKVSADNDLDDLISSFKQCEEIDKTKELDEIRTYNLAELGIGCNPKITKAIGYILTDEKIIGSAHIAFGSNKMFGGTSVSHMHWDFVTTPQVNIEVEHLDGTKKLIMEKGKLV